MRQSMALALGLAMGLAGLGRGAPAALRGLGVLAVLFVGAAPAAADDTPWRLAGAIGLPDGLTLGGSHRIRYETLDGQFRAGRNGGDQVLALRTTLAGELRLGNLRLGAELMDSRAALADPGTPLGTAIVNTLEPLQAYAGLTTENLFVQGALSRLRAGRVTMDVGSRRLVARNRYRNTVNAFTGLDWQWREKDGRQWRAFVTLPLERRPRSFAKLIDNDARLDQESTDVVFWGLHHGVPRLPWGDKGEIYLFGLHESDGPGRPTRNRQLYTPGLRLHRPAATGAFDYEIEAVLQFGRSRLSSAGADTTDLDHFATFQHLELGYSFAAPWSPRLAVQFDHASGDGDPDDGDNGRFDTLFGARRFDFGPTGIYGPFARSNLITLGLRLQVKPLATLDGFVAFRAYWLAADRDAWTTSGLRDATGAAGRYLGQQIEARLRWHAVPGNLRLETGLARLFAGTFLDNAPNSNGEGDATYLYAQTTLLF